MFSTVACSHCERLFNRKTYQLKKPSKSGLIFCSNRCMFDARKSGKHPDLVPDHYGNGGRRYRDVGLREHGPVCKNCGYGATVKMLDVHHRDGDRSNTSVDNLEVLCVWCHALVTRRVEYHQCRRLQEKKPTKRRAPIGYRKVDPHAAISLLATGLNMSTTAKRLGVSHWGLSRCLRRLKIRHWQVRRGDLSSCTNLKEAVQITDNAE